jgi:hypothetical protein
VVVLSTAESGLFRTRNLGLGTRAWQRIRRARHRGNIANWNRLESAARDSGRKLPHLGRHRTLPDSSPSLRVRPAALKFGRLGRRGRLFPNLEKKGSTDTSPSREAIYGERELSGRTKAGKRPSRPGRRNLRPIIAFAVQRIRSTIVGRRRKCAALQAMSCRCETRSQPSMVVPRWFQEQL